MSTQIVFIDGERTRAAVDEMAGQKEGMTKVCKEKGISTTTLNKICREGYGNLDTVNRYINAGIPIKTAKRPVPCRIRRKHRKTKRPELTLQDCGLQDCGIKNEPVPEPPRQIRLEDIQNSDIKELLISHLTALIEDLKKI